MLHVALGVFGPALVHIREVRRDNTTCSTWQKLEVSKWHQMTPGLSAGGAETLESRRSLGHLCRAASFITCPTARLGCTPGKGDEGKEKSLMHPWTLPALICMASAFAIAQADLSLVFPSFPESWLCKIMYKHNFFVL